MSVVNMDDYGKIRSLNNGKVTSQRQMAKITGKARQTVKKYKDGEVLPGQKQTRNRAPSVLTDAVEDYVRERLAESDALPGKMKYTSERIYDLLVQDLDFKGGRSTVRGLVHRLKAEPKEGFLPLSFDPGESMQVDWGTVTVKLRGEETEVKYFCAVLCYSGAIFTVAYRNENTGSFLDALRRAFEYFGGVPRKVVFDNDRVAVESGSGADAVYVAAYDMFQAHYSFEAVSCNTRSGHEKGVVERAIQYVRDNAMVPMLSAKSMDELNESLRKWCLNDMNRIRYRTDSLISELLEEERGALYSLPLTPYDPSPRLEVKVSSYCTVRYEENSYSVPCEYCGKTVTVCARPETVEVFAGGSSIASHERCFEKGRCIYRLEHFLSLLKKKRRGILQCEPVKKNVPEYFTEWLSKQNFGARKTVDLLENGLRIGFRAAMRGETPEEIAEDKPFAYEDEVTVDELDLSEYDALFETCGDREGE